jgi:hypothetical protein
MNLILSFDDFIGENFRSLSKSRGFSVIPMGKVNTKTGSASAFNIYDTWKGDKMYVEIYEVMKFKGKGYDKQTVIAFTSEESKNRTTGEMYPFDHDQTGKSLFSGRYVKTIPLSSLKSEGLGSVSGYVFK